MMQGATTLEDYLREELVRGVVVGVNFVEVEDGTRTVSQSGFNELHRESREYALQKLHTPWGIVHAVFVIGYDRFFLPHGLIYFWQETHLDPHFEREHWHECELFDWTMNQPPFPVNGDTICIIKPKPPLRSMMLCDVGEVPEMEPVGLEHWEFLGQRHGNDVRETPRWLRVK